MRIPKHIAVIPDGNRRWAKEKGLEKHQGYEHGLAPGLALLRAAKALGVEELSYYGFTIDNCKRPAVQVESFRSACVEAVNLIMSEDISLLVVGNGASDCFPSSLLPYNKQRVRVGEGGLRVNFLVNYGWEWDLAGCSGATASREAIADSLQSREVSRIDLVIRWGGRRRLSGLLPVQSVYADFYVLDALWPDFHLEHLTDAVQWYDKQDPTLGG